MKPMTVLLLGIVAWLALNVVGFVRDWPFGAGVLLTLCFLLFVVIWAFQGAGTAMEEFFGNRP